MQEYQKQESLVNKKCAPCKTLTRRTRSDDSSSTSLWSSKTLETSSHSGLSAMNERQDFVRE